MVEVCSTVYGIVLAVTYGIVIYLNVRIWRRMRDSFAIACSTGAPSTRTHVMQRQFNIVLMLQALVPFITEVVPGTALAYTYAAGISMRYASYAIPISYMWMPVLNPLMVMSLLKPYRTAPSYEE